MVVGAERIAQAADLPQHASLFGVTIGQPLSVAKCQVSTGTLGFSKAVQGDEVCSYQKFPDLPQSIDLYFPKNGQPSFVPGMFRSFQATVRDGTVKKLKTFTTGLASQDEILKTLSDKYGNPAVLLRHDAQNLMGASFQTIEAHWEVGKDVVNFLGAIAVDAGSIEVITADEVARDSSNAKSNKGPAL